MTESKGSLKPKDFVRIIEDELRIEWERIREIKFNPNIKGKSYEESLKEFFQKYLGGPLNFDVRVGVLDKELITLERLTPQENEFDVVGTFKNSIPRIIIDIHGMKYVPLDAVCFISEVKQDLTKTNLKSDLKKFSKISGLTTEKRFSISTTGRYSVKHVLKALLYYNRKGVIQNELLEKYINDWDFIVLINDDILIINPKLPISKIWGATDEKKIVIVKGNALFHFMLDLSGSFTYPVSPISTHQTYFKMLG